MVSFLLNKYSCLFILFMLSSTVMMATDGEKGKDTRFSVRGMPYNGDYSIESVQAHQLRSERTWDTPEYDEVEIKSTVTAMGEDMGIDYHYRIKRYIDRYANQDGRQYVEQLIGLSSIFFPYYEQTLKNHGLPDDLKYLSVIESGLNPRATSRVGAKGPWQFMPATGRQFRLRVTKYEEQRSDVVRSTEAAARYLKQLHGMYDDWALALAAYNCGPGNVNKAIRRARSKDYWKVSRYLPRETRNYVPKFMAFQYLMKYHERHNFYPVYPIADLQNTGVIKLFKTMNFKEIKAKSGVSENIIKYLNASYRRHVIPARYNRPRYLILPIEGLERLKGELLAQDYSDDIYVIPYSKQRQSDELVEYRIIQESYQVVKGDHLQKIAAKFNCSVTNIKDWNNLSSSTISPGQLLIIKRTVAVKKEQPKKDDTKFVMMKYQILEKAGFRDAITTGVDLKESQVIEYKLSEKESLESIEKLYKGVTVESLMVLNGLSPFDEVQIGKVIKIAIPADSYNFTLEKDQVNAISFTQQ